MLKLLFTLIQNNEKIYLFVKRESLGELTISAIIINFLFN